MTKRLQKELKEFIDEPKDWCKAELASDDNLYLWRAEVYGPDGTPYEKGVFKVEIEVPTDYPFKPPKVKFVTKIYHPNVKSDGSFCTDILTTQGCAEVYGPDGTPYEKGVFKVEIEVPTDYPFKPPKVKFVTKIYHPNVKSDGSFCTDILTTQGWSPQLKIQQVLLTIRQILEEPNLENPLEADIAQQYKTDKNTFIKTAKEWTKKYATK
eukprot:TRINITY_DN53827_c0_g1_i1.p1 TRINITY_DN53827_c0_g1~~TRINITY_DN53827_c0_g1_i1.p1  ORF type:complete len:210 (+),score=39.46 TRINITY_DN53827_c0_g1_i1:35-664(+)